MTFISRHLALNLLSTTLFLSTPLSPFLLFNRVLLLQLLHLQLHSKLLFDKYPCGTWETLCIPILKQQHQMAFYYLDPEAPSPHLVQQLTPPYGSFSFQGDSCFHQHTLLLILGLHLGTTLPKQVNMSTGSCFTLPSVRSQGFMNLRLIAIIYSGILLGLNESGSHFKAQQ